MAAAEHYSPFMNHLLIGAHIDGIATFCIRLTASETYGGCCVQAINELAKLPLIAVINAAAAGNGVRYIIANALVNARTRGALEQSADNRLDREMGVPMGAGGARLLCVCAALRLLSAKYEIMRICRGLVIDG